MTNFIDLCSSSAKISVVILPASAKTSKPVATVVGGGTGGDGGDVPPPEDFQRGQGGRLLGKKTSSFNQYRTVLAYMYS